MPDQPRDDHPDALARLAATAPRLTEADLAALEAAPAARLPSLARLNAALTRDRLARRPVPPASLVADAAVALALADSALLRAIRTTVGRHAGLEGVMPLAWATAAPDAVAARALTLATTECSVPVLTAAVEAIVPALLAYCAAREALAVAEAGADLQYPVLPLRGTI